MARFASVSALVFVIGLIISRSAPNSIFGILEVLGFFGLLASGLYYGYRFVRWLKDRLLWKVRNKLIIFFSFVGLLPVVILTAIAWYSTTLIFRQLSVVYLEKEFSFYSATLHESTERTVLRHYRSEGRTSLADLLRQEQEAISLLDPGLAYSSFHLLRKSTTRQGVIYQPTASFPEGRELDDPLVPPWAREGFHGMVSDAGKLYFKSLLPVREGNADYLVYLDLPLDDKLAENIRRRTLLDLRLFDFKSEEMETAMSDLFGSHRGFFDIRWAHIMSPVRWENEVNATTVNHGAVIEVPLKTLFDHYFNQEQGFGDFILNFILALLILFLLVEAISVMVGLTIARSITRSVHNIYAGTQNIQEGNFDFRIPSQNRDQLDSMATAFNRMSDSVVQLMSQLSEKERLEKEIEIAREVQTHLFPRQLPSIRRLQLAGACLPARTVSGDYYDFIPHSESRLDLIVADISGKGISAALLMANLQSSIRSHIGYQGVNPNGGRAIAAAVGAINSQLYKHTAPEKFATLVLCRVDAEKMKMTYCNAGHNPPIIVSGGCIAKMTKGGMVAGLFEDPDYEQETLDMKTGDLVVFYTDGVVEAENPRGEQFDDHRLETLVQSNAFLTAEDIRSLIIEEITQWVDGREQRDDITVVAMKVEGESAGTPASLPAAD